MLGGIGLSVPLMMSQREIFVNHTHLLSLRAPESSVDNRSRDTVSTLLSF